MIDIISLSSLFPCCQKQMWIRIYGNKEIFLLRMFRLEYVNSLKPLIIYSFQCLRLQSIILSHSLTHRTCPLSFRLAPPSCSPIPTFISVCKRENDSPQSWTFRRYRRGHPCTALRLHSKQVRRQGFKLLQAVVLLNVLCKYEFVS